jgi:hypothetical protein
MQVSVRHQRRPEGAKPPADVEGQRDNLTKRLEEKAKRGVHMLERTWALFSPAQRALFSEEEKERLWATAAQHDTETATQA